jgi:hypothetical protein
VPAPGVEPYTSTSFHTAIELTVLLASPSICSESERISVRCPFDMRTFATPISALPA